MNQLKIFFFDFFFVIQINKNREISLTKNCIFLKKTHQSETTNLILYKNMQILPSKNIIIINFIF
jgi:hypothetical protein